MRRPTPDQPERDRFAAELDRNFSVIAAAGAGKTTAITDRIVHIAQQHPEWLPRLVVVTFTNRAADDMQQRARQRTFEAGVPLHALTALNRAFFGTIHSFCAKLLTEHGYHLGLPSRLDVITDDEELWSDFVQRTSVVGESLSERNRTAFSRHVQLRELMELGRRGQLPLRFENEELDCPSTIHLGALYNYPARAGAIRISAVQQLLREWEGKFNAGDEFLPLIEFTTTGPFRTIWEKTFNEFSRWLSCCALKVAAEIQAKYRAFRAAHGAVTFDDQVAFALQLTKMPEVISAIRGNDYIVILDEAQDTDPEQFSILTEITRPLNARGEWLDELHNPPRAGRFCMVGDFQQSIYGERADLATYRRIHNALTASDNRSALEFSVTFRLDQSQVEFVNACFDPILNRAGQVGFIKLTARPDSLSGQMVRLRICSELLREKGKPSDTEKARSEARQLAQWLKATSFSSLRARSWGEVAILCPRKKWLAEISAALRRVGLTSQVQSETDLKGDSPAYAWFTALVTIMTQPRCAFEIAGVLREVFGIADHDLAIFCDGCGERLQIEQETREQSAVARALNLLTVIHSDIANAPLFNAIDQIVRLTDLRTRLNALPADEFDHVGSELDLLLQAAASAESEGATLEEFAELLRANFSAEREASVPRSGAIQLITSQKAKGLEWDAVIVPFFSRRLHTADDDFPRVFATAELPQPIVAFSRGDIPIAMEEALETARRYEMERLLYVALTRARHTVVLTDDRELFAKRDGASPSTSLTRWLQSDRHEPNAPEFDRLAAEPLAHTATSQFQAAKEAEEKSLGQTSGLPPIELAPAQAHAEEFPRRFVPSGFTRTGAATGATGADEWNDAENEFRATVLPSAATRYGVWWHDLVQRMPWSSSRDVWDSFFAAEKNHSPDAERSNREWTAFRKRISSLSDFAHDFGNNGVIAHAEMPFLWVANPERCLEGVIDLAIFEAAQNRWFILDWKTNAVDRDKLEKLRAFYRPQIAGYWKALSSITGSTVASAIYSTATGELLSYSERELAAEWEVLMQRSAADFQSNTRLS